MFHFLSSVGTQTAIENYIVFAYIILMIGIILEGEFFLIFAGILTHLCLFKIQIIIPIIIAAALVKTILWYRVGYWIDKRAHKKFISYIETKVLSFMPKFKENPFWSIFISKFVYGVNHFVLIFSGMVHVPFKKYFWAEMYASVFWLAAYFSLGYFFSYAAFSITKNIRLAFLILIGLIILIFVIQKIISIVMDLFGEYTK